jgi:RNA polymerase sigma-70 factor (ECF subfamily)
MTSSQPGSATHDRFLKAYDDLSDAIFRHCFYRCFDREKARELMQECFMRTWERLAAGDDIKNLRAFLYRVATNLVIDSSRRKTSDSLDKMTEEQGFEIDDPAALGRIEIAAEASRIEVMLEKIDPKYRAAVAMRYIDGFSPKEIAEIVGESENAVSVRIHRGLAMLREHFA